MLTLKQSLYLHHLQRVNNSK